MLKLGLFFEILQNQFNYFLKRINLKNLFFIFTKKPKCQEFFLSIMEKKEPELQ